MDLRITAAWAGVLGVLVLFEGANVVRNRVKAKWSVGDGSTELAVAAANHGKESALQPHPPSSYCHAWKG
jgi:uncharacterized membrane protein YecN with MAPEG domain